MTDKPQWTPELYEAGIEALHALKSARDFIMSKHGTSNPHRDKTIADLEAALAKARGVTE